jgi:hypothetical protein
VPARELELARSASGGTFLRLRGQALPHAVSVTHTSDLAAAVVVLPARPRPLGAPTIAALALSALALLLAAAAVLLMVRL